MALRALLVTLSSEERPQPSSSSTWVVVLAKPAHGAPPPWARLPNHPKLTWRLSTRALPTSTSYAYPPPPPTENPYVSTTPAPAFGKGAADIISDRLSKWGKMFEETAGSVWQHIKTSPNVADTAWGRLSQGTKLLAEGGSENIFKHSFDTLPDERLQDSYACFLSTSSGPIAGTLFVSTKKIAFSSDRPLSLQPSLGQTIWSYYKVVVPVDKMRIVNAFKNPKTHAEKYIQIITMDNHEFWFMGFLNHDKALKVLQEAQAHFLK